MYIIVRTDLSPVQQTVQAIHAALIATTFQKQIPSNLHLVVCQTTSEQELKDLIFRFYRKSIRFHPFFEPDLGNELTAVASDIVFERHKFRNLKLLKQE